MRPTYVVENEKDTPGASLCTAVSHRIAQGPSVLDDIARARKCESETADWKSNSFSSLYWIESFMTGSMSRPLVIGGGVRTGIFTDIFLWSFRQMFMFSKEYKR